MTRRPLTPLVAAGLAALVLGCTAVAGPSGGTAQAPLACSVEVTARGGLLSVEGVASSDTALDGRYRLRVARGGARLEQGGRFSLSPGDTVRLGEVTLNGSAAGLDADLTLDVNGQSYRCPVDP